MNPSFSNDRTWKGFLVVVSLILASLLAAMVYLPDAKPQFGPAERAQKQAAVRSATVGANQKADSAREDAAKYLWSEKPDAIAPQALGIVTGAAKTHGLKLSAFRPQKPVVEGDLEVLNYVVALEGRFPAVADFLRTLETPGNRLAVNLFQVTSSDGATDSVTATVGLVAFREVSQGAAKK